MAKLKAFYNSSQTALSNGRMNITGLPGVYLEITESNITLGYRDEAVHSFTINGEVMEASKERTVIALKNGDVVINMDDEAILSVSNIDDTDETEVVTEENPLSSDNRGYSIIEVIIIVLITILATSTANSIFFGNSTTPVELSYEIIETEVETEIRKIETETEVLKAEIKAIEAESRMIGAEIKVLEAKIILEALTAKKVPTTEE